MTLGWTSQENAINNNWSGTNEGNDERRKHHKEEYFWVSSDNFSFVEKLEIGRQAA